MMLSLSHCRETNPKRRPDLNFLPESSLQSTKLKDTISALLLYEPAVKYAVISARGMLCIPWRFFSTEEHFRPPHSLLRLSLIRPFSCSTGTRQPLQAPACWEPSTATALPSPGPHYPDSPNPLPFQPLSWHLVKNVVPGSRLGIAEL